MAFWNRPGRSSLRGGELRQPRPQQCWSAAWEKVRAIGLQAGDSRTYQMPLRTGAPRDATRERAGCTRVSDRCHTAAKFGWLLGKQASKAQAPFDEVWRGKGPGRVRRTDSLMQRPNAGNSSGVPTGVPALPVTRPLRFCGRPAAPAPALAPSGGGHPKRLARGRSCLDERI
jgi:hypothetical protein